MEPWIIVIIVIVALAVILFLFAALCDKFAFGRRFDKGSLLKYFTAEEFGLSAEPVQSKGLKGYVYLKDKPDAKINDKIIIFCHGMGAGHIAYMTEIAYFCNQGYTVLALDSRGCNYSEGKNIKGFYSGVKCAVSAINIAQSKFKDADIYLVGHSWGAYSALCASGERKVKGVVAISAPVTPVKTVKSIASNYLSRPFAAILAPFWYALNFFKYGVKGNANAAKCAQKNGVPTLLIQGGKDNVVNKSIAAYYRADGVNIAKLFEEEKAHNPYNTLNAEKKLAELSNSVSNAAKMTEEERNNYFKNFDFTAATEEDLNVMQTIVNFIKNN